MEIKCPACGATNPEKTWQCVCGHYFVTAENKSILPKEERSSLIGFTMAKNDDFELPPTEEEIDLKRIQEQQVREYLRIRGIIMLILGGYLYTSSSVVVTTFGAIGLIIGIMALILPRYPVVVVIGAALLIGGLWISYVGGPEFIYYYGAPMIIWGVIEINNFFEGDLLDVTTQEK